MEDPEKFVEEFNESQDHIYDKGYWSGRVNPNWPSNKIATKTWAWVSFIIIVLIIAWQIISRFI